DEQIGSTNAIAQHTAERYRHDRHPDGETHLEARLTERHTARDEHRWTERDDRNEACVEGAPRDAARDGEPEVARAERAARARRARAPAQGPLNTPRRHDRGPHGRGARAHGK